MCYDFFINLESMRLQVNIFLDSFEAFFADNTFNAAGILCRDFFVNTHCDMPKIILFDIILLLGYNRKISSV